MSKHPRFSLGRAQKRNLFAHVVEDLGTRIIKGDLTPDEPFPIEADLGREFGASRSVIREAVKSLAARGLIESKTRTGIRVMPPTHWNLLDPEVLSWRYSTMPPAQFYDELFEVRLMIEPPAAALAAQRANASDIGEITAAFAEMTKAAINHLTRCLAFEWAGHNINVNSVGPTFIWTDGTRPYLSDARYHAATLGHIPLGRIGEPIDVVGAVIFLASPAASLITGASLLIDGGWSLG